MIRHHLRIGELAASNLARQPVRTLVVVTVYSLLVAAVVSLVLSVQALRREAELLLTEAPELIVQKLTGGRHDLIPVARIESIAAIRGVQTVRARVWGYSYDPPTRATFTLWGSASVPWDELELVAEDAPPVGGIRSLPPGACIVGQGVADARFLWVGDRLPLRRADGTLFAPRIVGIFSATSSILTNDLVILAPSEVRRTFGMASGDATDLAVEVYQPQEVATVALKIQELSPDSRVISRAQVLATYDAVFDWRGGVWAAILGSCLAAFAVLVWDKATGLSAEEYHTIGLLKAVGWTPREVLELCAWQGAIVSAISLLTGLLVAEVHLLWLDGALFSRLLRGWSVLFPAIEIRPEVDAWALIVCLPLAVLPYVVATLVPSWRASISEPDAILRS